MQRIATVLIAVVAVLGVPAAAAGSSDPFPAPDALQGRVAFWRDVFAVHDLDRVVVHHMDHPELVYDVVDLPGERGDRYTDEQQAYVDTVRESWEDRLRAIADRVGAGKKPAKRDRDLARRVREVAGKDGLAVAFERVRTQRGLRARFRRAIEISGRYDAAFRDVFRAYGLPEDLALRPLVESSYQVRARSSAGAAGIWQFTRSTGRSYLRIDSAVDERYDPVAATEGAARYLGDAYERLGDWALALTSYNYGVAGMARAAKAHGADIVRVIERHDGRTFGFASRNFYASYLAARDIARDPQSFYGPGVRFEPPLNDERVQLSAPATAVRLARRYGVDLQALVAINPAWTRRTVRSGLAIPAGTSVWLPAGTLERVARGEVREPDLSLPPDLAGAVYRVRAGDTLSGIAARHGISVARLRALNDIGSRDSRIYVGETLQVGGAVDRRTTHVVASGDTLLGIALRYGVRLTALLQANDLNERSVIVPGQRIRIPAG